MNRPTLWFKISRLRCKFSPSVSHSVVPDSLQPHGLQSTRLLCPWDFPGKDTGVGCHFPSLGDHPNSGIQPGFPALQADSLPTELQGNPKFSPNRPVDLMLYKSNTSSSFFKIDMLMWKESKQQIILKKTHLGKEQSWRSCIAWFKT